MIPHLLPGIFAGEEGQKKRLQSKGQLCEKNKNL